MRVVVDIPDDIVDDIRETVRNGSYEDPEEFLEQALRTQLKLESGEQESLVSFSDAVEASDAAGTEESQSKRKQDQATFNETLSAQSQRQQSDLTDLSVRDFDVETTAPPSPDRIDTGPLWGQYNRIFPMKLSLRRLAIVLDEAASDGAPYQQFRNETARVAREYGLRLQEIDDEKGRGRGEKLSAAFPTGEKVDRSLDRYKTHFVGQIDSSGDLTGALPNLKFVNIDPEQREFGITEAGLEFAQIENPILDADIRSDHSLSDGERRFYLDHVEAEHPAENEAMQIVATAIQNGINRPDPLSERVGELSDDWTSAQASTIRSGLVGRMHELELVARTRVGSRGIKYELTDRGKQELLE